MNNRIPVLIAGAAITVGAAAVYSGNNNRIIADRHSVTVNSPAGAVRLSSFGEGTIKVSHSPATDIKQPDGVAAIDYSDQSASVFVYPDSVVMSDEGIEVSVSRADGKVVFRDDNRNILLSEIAPFTSGSDTVTLSFLAPAGGFFYGAGERGHSLTINNDSLTMYNRQNYGYTEGDPRISQMGISVPYVASDAGFGLLFDDYDNASLRLNDNNISYSTPKSTAPDYFFINGKKNLVSTTDRFTRLTGRQPLPPFWTLGYVTSKYGYHNAGEAFGCIDSLKNDGYPVDGMVLDLYWYGKETDMGRLDWNKEQWGDSHQFLDSMKNRGVNIVLITQPYINKIGAIDNYNMLAQRGLLVKDADGNVHDVTTWVGDAGMFDVSNQATRRWLWNRLDSLTQEGVAGWWGDLGEPEVHPLTMVHSNGLTDSQYHNRYGNDWSKLIYDGLRENYPDMRPMLMMRGGTTGLQKYGVFPWTTDVSRSWGGFQPQIKLMLSSGLSGLGYMGSDVGGFAVDPENPTDEELYIRWLQMGTFSPMLRTHAQLKPEPYHYPAVEEISKRFIRMRYEWLPYNYTLAFENATTGAPLARPLNFYGDNPGEKYASITDEYLWGRDVLVAPVMTQGAVNRKVTFPAGTWVNWYKPFEKFKGGETAVVAAPLDRLPLFVREGSFIPQYPYPIENVTQYNPSLITVRYFPAKEKSSFTLFDDDRMSPSSIEEEAYLLTTFSGQEAENEIKISVTTSGNGYEGMSDVRRLIVEIPMKKAPAKVTTSMSQEMPQAMSVRAIRQYGWTYNAETEMLSVVTPLALSSLEISVKR